VAELPPERLATCHACAMCTAPVPPAERFRPDTKCCTYQPKLPNFAVGDILRDPGALARDRLRARILVGAGVDPTGVGPPLHWELLYARAPFGRTRAMLCPWFVEDGGRCGVWAHREGVCATWFCRHERGDAGEAWWTAVKRYLESVEEDLATWCVLRLDPGPAARARLGTKTAPPGDLPADDFGEAPTPEEHAARWGRWAGRELAFFEACAELVAGLDPARVLDLCGPATHLAAENVRDAEAARRG
jgi:hypothetical protein